LAFEAFLLLKLLAVSIAASEELKSFVLLMLTYDKLIFVLSSSEREGNFPSSYSNTVSTTTLD
jgi:hypothetical protein